MMKKGINAMMGSVLSWVVLVALGLLAIMAGMRWLGIGSGPEDDIPKEVLVNFVPADFDFELDEAFTLAVLTHPYRYRGEFEQLVRQVNTELLRHLAARMDLPDSLQHEVVEAYDRHHNYLSELYFQDFVALRDTSADIYETFYANKNRSAVAHFKEVASKYTCFLTNHIASTVLRLEGGKLYAVGEKVQTPCSVALEEGLAPMMARLRERAAVEDFSLSRGLMEEKVKTVVSELATFEIRSRKGLSRQFQTKVWGFAISSTEMEITAISILKAGFDLDKGIGLELDEANKVLEVRLPKAEVLSHEVYPRMDKLDIGWWREVGEEDLNKAFNLLRAEFRREALEEDQVLLEAERRAEEVMNTLLMPTVALIGPNIRLSVMFVGAQNGGYETRQPLD